MRRLYSTFAPGLPGVGLLLLRLTVGLALLAFAFSPLRGDLSMGSVAMVCCQAGCAVLMISGLGTPIVGTVVALIETWQILTQTRDRWSALLMGSMGAALAMLGPGLWSIDAYLFGWRRIKTLPARSVSRHP